MEDARYTAALRKQMAEGVPVRVRIDTRANSSYPLNPDRLQELRDAGIPTRRRIASGIPPWKMMLFEGQDTVQFSDPELNFPPLESFRNRSVGRYNAETQALDVIMYRITDRSYGS